MTANAGTLRQLDFARELLINPTKASMQECQRLLAVVVATVSKCPRDSAFLAEVRSALHPIKLLLSSAAAFWAGRQQSVQPPQTYTPEGRLSLVPSSGSVSVEI